MTKKILTEKARKRFECSECGALVAQEDYNFTHSNCKWCAYKHTKTYAWRKKLEEFERFIASE